MSEDLRPLDELAIEYIAMIKNPNRPLGPFTKEEWAIYQELTERAGGERKVSELIGKATDVYRMLVPST